MRIVCCDKTLQRKDNWQVPELVSGPDGILQGMCPRNAGGSLVSSPARCVHDSSELLIPNTRQQTEGQ